MSVCIESLEDTTLFAVVANKIAQLPAGINVILEERNILPNKMNFQLSGVRRRLKPLKKTNYTVFILVSLFKRRHKESKKNVSIRHRFSYVQGLY